MVKKALANLMFSQCGAQCLFDYDFPHGRWYGWNAQSHCYEKNPAGCKGTEAQAFAIERKALACKANHRPRWAGAPWISAMKCRTPHLLSFILLSHASALKFGNGVSSNGTEDCTPVQPALSSALMNTYCEGKPSQLSTARACDGAMTVFLQKALANFMFKSCGEASCVFDFDQPDQIVYQWDSSKGCYEAGGAGNPCFGSVDQALAIKKKSKMCQDAGCIHMVPTFSNALMTRYCGDLSRTGEDRSITAQGCEDDTIAVQKSLVNHMFSHCGTWCIFDFDDPAISYGWWPEKKCWQRGGCEGHPEGSVAKEVKAKSCELTTTTTTSTSTSTSTITTSTSTTSTSTTTITSTSTTTTSTSTVTSTTTTSTSTITSTTTTSTSTSTTTTSTTTITSTTTTSTSTTTETSTTTTLTTTSTTTITTTTATDHHNDLNEHRDQHYNNLHQHIDLYLDNDHHKHPDFDNHLDINKHHNFHRDLHHDHLHQHHHHNVHCHLNDDHHHHLHHDNYHHADCHHLSDGEWQSMKITTTFTKTTTALPATCGICDLEAPLLAGSWSPKSSGWAIQQLLDGNEMTWELMWQSKGKPNMEHVYLMGSWNSVGSLEPGVWLTISGDGTINLMAVLDGDLKEWSPQCGKNLLDGAWHHIVTTFSRSERFMRLYVDGCLEAELQRSYDKGPLASLGSAKGKAFEHDSRFGRLALWDRALSQEEILHRNAECRRDGLVAVYRFDGDYKEGNGSGDVRDWMGI
eukprot:g19740.t1